LTFSFLFTLFISSSAFANLNCVDFFTSKSSESVRKAILRGVELYDMRVEFSAINASSSTIYLHGTSIESVRRSVNGDFFSGTPVKDFEQLSSFFNIYQKYMVVHGFKVEGSKIDKRDEGALRSYAEFAAKRFYLLRYLQDYSLYNSYFIFDFLSVVDGDLKIEDLVYLYKDDPEVMHKTDVFRKIENVDLSFILKNAEARKGVILVIDGPVEKSVVVEKDVEHDGAVALMSAKGIPLKNISAIIPLSNVERGELLRLLQN
jgi:hypothetical protein